MSQSQPPVPPTPGPKARRLRLGAGLGLCAALAIAGGLWLSNNGTSQAAACDARPQVQAAIDLAAAGELAALQPTAQGRGFADLAFIGEDGEPMDLSAFAGTPILVNFWASWCVPCREEMPALAALGAAYEPERFLIVPINLDLGEAGLDKARAFLAETGLTSLPLYADPSFSAFERLKREGVAVGLPATLLLDGEGCEVAVLQGPAEWDSDDGRKVIDALLDI